MHLYNAWLPPPVAEQTVREKESFAGVVKAVKESYRVDDPESVYDTLKWISVLDLFVNAKSDLLLEDVTELVELGLQLFKVSDKKLYAQVRWGNVLVRFLNKYRKTLTLKIQWSPFYDTLVHTHFTRNTGPEGWRLRQRHFEMVTALVRVCRRFFPPGSAFEIWSEFRLLLENPWHNSCFEGSGFLRLFLPTNLDNQDFFSQEWFKLCLYHWDSVPNCQFWNSQWLSITARVIKNYNFIDWESFLPTLFNRYLSVFEVPVANGSGLNPFSVDVPRNTKFLFSNRTATPGKAIAKSIIYLLKPGGSAQQHFEKLVNLLEQYYHPSNGGRWTFSLERFLSYLVTMFLKRLQHDQTTKENGEESMLILQQADRVAFVHALLKFIDRGQYSKYENLAETVAAATSMLSYVEPSLVLPFLASRFQMALETVTATHQLKSAVTSVAFAGRSLFLTASSTPFSNPDDVGGTNSFIDLLTNSLSNALLGIDANDPPKTLATMQLIGSLFSNMAVLEDDGRELSPMSEFHFSEWLDEFLCRLFSLLQHLEPSSVMSEGISSPATAGTFLVEDGPYYFCMLEILLARLSGPLYKQALNKITRFVMSNVLPGAIAEVGLLCCACVHTNPEEAVAHLVQPLLVSAMSSLRGTPNTGYGGRITSDTIRLSKEKAALSPALEVSIEYHLKVLSVAISYGGPALLHHKDEFKEIIFSAFDSTSWKVNGAGDHVLRSLLGSLILYYPTDQYKSMFCHPVATYLEEWISTKDFPNTKSLAAPKWHIPCHEEVQFATELLNLHFDHALDDLQQICQSKLHSDSGNEKEHLKVTLLRVDSSLQGVLSCLPDLRPSSRNKMAEDLGQVPFLVAGATGSVIGTTELREKATLVIHATCKYLLEEKSDDSVLLLLVIRIMDALGNYGSSEYEEWLNHKQAWKLESAAIVEPPVNFVVSSHSKGKRRPRWALLDKTYMHSTWRSSQASYHLFHTLSDVSPSEHVLSLVNDLLNLSLHSYETVRLFAGRALVKIMKRWPSTISNCVYSLSENLRSSTSPEHVVLGSCAVLSTQTVIKRLTTDTKALSSFLLGILSSSHHESLKAQKAINELFVKYNIYFSGVSRSIFRTSNKNPDVTDFSELVSEIGSLSFESSNLHWRYNLMANRIMLLLAMASRNDPNSSEILSQTAGHFLKNLKSDLPQTRILAISALNILLKESPYKAADAGRKTKSLLEESLTNVFQEEGFFKETLSSLSHVHIITDTDGTSSRGNAANSSFQSLADKSITHFYFDFSASWPRTPNWISVLSNETFYSNFAKIFKRLVQECGYPVLTSLKNTLEEFVNAKERSRQCVAAEALAGVVHSDVYAVSEVWDSWVMVQLQNIVHSPSVESIPEWAACIRYAVTGKGKNGTRAPLLRERVMDCLMNSLDMATSTTSTVVAKRYTFLAAALIEISPPRMTVSEMQLHLKLLEELLGNMNHSSAQVRESIGVTLSVVCSNIRLHASFIDVSSDEEKGRFAGKNLELENWDKKLLKRASDLVMVILDTNPSDSLEAMMDKTDNGTSKDVSRDDINWMETMFHFIISSLKSGRSSVLLDVIVGLLYPMVSLQETSNKDLATLAKAAFELLKWRVFYEPHLQTAVSLILSSASDTNWRTRSATLTFMRTFMYRHAFILPKKDEKEIWETVEKLLMDNQIEVREHAAAVLAGLMKSGNGELAEDFRHKALEEANILLKKRRQRNIRSGPSVVSIHGSVLSLAACVLSVPYDMPSWLPEHVTLLARFVSEPSPVKSTVTKAVADFRRTHADTWSFQKDAFTEEQLEILADTSSSSSYFA